MQDILVKIITHLSSFRGESSFTMTEVKEAIDDLSGEFSFYKTYQTPEVLKEMIRTFLAGTVFSVVRNA